MNLIQKKAMWLALAVYSLSAPALQAGEAYEAIHLSNGKIFINDEAQPGRFSVSNSEFKFLYFYVPAHGLFVISDKQFSDAVQVGEFEGHQLSFAVDGISFKLVSRTAILGKNQPAWTHHDSKFALDVQTVMFGYGDSELTPYDWPNQIKNHR